MRRITMGLAVAVSCLGVLACGGKPKEPAPAAPASAPAAGAAPSGPAAAAPAPAKPRSELDDLREAIKDYVTLLADCDKQWFADVKEDRVDKWEMPVAVKQMEQKCDRLLPLFEKVQEKGAFRSAAMDDFIRLSALAADRYLVLGFRCKKVGVRDRAPYKAEVAALRDTLRADVARLKEGVGPILALSDADVNANVNPPEGVVKAADRALGRLRADLATWVEAPLKETKPTWRYSLRTSAMIATRAAAALRSHGTEGLALSGPADELAKAFAEASAFYTGDYFDREENEGKKIRGAVIKADGPYKQALRKVTKTK